MSAETEKYEGLNLPQLLDLMHGIEVPEPVSWVPQTEGWWVVLAWSLTVVLLAAIKFVAHRRRNRYRREALEELRGIAKTVDSDPSGSAAAIALLVKRTALAVWPREQVAAKTGAEWAAFLAESANEDRRVVDGAPGIATAAYDPAASSADLIEPARRWIQVHRA